MISSHSGLYHAQRKDCFSIKLCTKVSTLIVAEYTLKRQSTHVISSVSSLRRHTSLRGVVEGCPRVETREWKRIIIVHNVTACFLVFRKFVISARFFAEYIWFTQKNVVTISSLDLIPFIFLSDISLTQTFHMRTKKERRELPEVHLVDLFL